MGNKTEDWLIIGVIGFLGGVVANIIVPVRRGAWGFLGAAVIGVFCGGVAGIIAHSYDAPYGVQWGLSALVGVLGDRLLSGILAYRKEHQNIYIQGGSNQNHFGQGDQIDRQE